MDLVRTSGFRIRNPSYSPPAPRNASILGAAHRDPFHPSKATRLTRSFRHRTRSEISPRAIVDHRDVTPKRKPLHFRAASRITRSIYLTPPLTLPLPVSIPYLQRRRKRNRRRRAPSSPGLLIDHKTYFSPLRFIYICISKPFRVEILIPLDVPRGG